MSQENVEIVKALSPPSGTELTELFADDAGAVDRLQSAAPLFHREFEFESHAGVREWMQPFVVW
jgi:hypothetical protein